MVNKTSTSWLDDDPEWHRLKKRIEKQPVSPRNTKITDSMRSNHRQSVAPPKISESTKKVEIALKLSVPKVKLPKISRKQTRATLIGFGLIIVVIIGIKTVPAMLKSKPKNPKQVAGETIEKPKFNSLLPDGKKEETIDSNVVYDPNKKVTSFTDKIGTVYVTVSQQELPEPFEANPDEEVKKLAESFSATEIINESNPKAYLGNDVKGPQTVIFHKKGILVFIFSPRQIEKTDWATYITKLL